MGSRLVQDINPDGSSSPNELISVNGYLFFSAELGQNSSSNSDTDTDNESGSDTEDTLSTETRSGNIGLIRTDGSDQGTTVLKSFDSVTNLVNANGQLYFIAGVNNQYQLWTSDGTTRGTKQVKDLYPNADPNFPQDLFEIDGVLFYSAIDKDREEIEGIVEGGIGKYPYVNGYEVWRREGKGVGSRFFRNLVPDKIITEITLDDGEEVPLFDEDGNPILIETGEYEEVQVIGEDGQPVMVDSNPPVLIEVPVVVNGTPVLDEDGNPVTELIVEKVPLTEFVPVTVPATELVKTATIKTTVFENDSFPKDFVGISGNYFFTAQASSFYSLETRTSDTLIGGLELWFSDGTEAGTRPININQNNYTFYEPIDGEYTPSDIIGRPEFGFVNSSSSSFPRELTPTRKKLYFVANDGIAGFELWSITPQGTDPTLISDINPGINSSSPEDLTKAGRNLYFSADDGDGRKLYYFNQSLSRPRQVRNSGAEPESLTAIGNKLYYSAESDLGREMWLVKGNKAELVSDINPGSDSSTPENFTIIKRLIAFNPAAKEANTFTSQPTTDLTASS